MEHDQKGGMKNDRVVFAVLAIVFAIGGAAFMVSKAPPHQEQAKSVQQAKTAVSKPIQLKPAHAKGQ